MHKNSTTTYLYASETHNTMIEVYVNDFIGATKYHSPQLLQQLSRAMLHEINCIFPPSSVTVHRGESPIAIKKLQE